FDDGPGPLTEEISASMKEAGAPSVFFVLGSKMGESGKARVKKAAADGHEAAVHGYNHATESGKPFTALSQAETLRQLSGVDASIKAATGKKPAFFRPPYGIISPEALKAIVSDLELTPVGWTIDTLDWSTKDPDELFEKTVSLIKQRGKGIVLMHDIHSQSRTASKRLVKWLAENGYKVVSPERMTKAFRGE
ncbi:MAG: polysaccharide deacetylase family protein, partial [Elusimicrobiota bacterium]|nr:polysaccharide deacetylase family protein [Elusimicrobiota bacterium]